MASQPDVETTRHAQMTALEGMMSSLLDQATKHFGSEHAAAWLRLMEKAHSSYSSIYSSDVPECMVCVALAKGLQGIESALESMAQAEEAE